jgi:hypothetical protein
MQILRLDNKKYPPTQKVLNAKKPAIKLALE